jgi:SAM-dependent methyltransferase
VSGAHAAVDDLLMPAMRTPVWTPQFACPRCGGLDVVSAATAPHSSGFTLNACGRCGFAPTLRDGFWTFLTPEEEAAAAPFAAQYARVREQEGRATLGAAEYRQLPVAERGSRHWREWQMRRVSCQRLSRVLSAIGRPPLRIADLGAGSGWLSRSLAALGHAVIAIDRSVDRADGLGAVRLADVPFAAVVADFARPPLAPAQFDAVVFNASLHYAADVAQTLSAAAHLLAPGGAIVVMDSPMFARRADGDRMVERENLRLRRVHGITTIVRPGRGFLTFGELDRFANARGMCGRFLPSRGHWRWRAGRFLARIRLGRAPAAFGVWVAQ